jgi:Ca2+-binding RTX toxin-like protein
LDSTFLNTVNSGIGAGVSYELIGGGGKDLPSGGNGNDELTGGIGQDWFDCGAGNDKITDFKPIEGDIESTNCE